MTTTQKNGVGTAIEQKCREAFDNYFHKIAATMTYDQWRDAFKVGFRCGREDCASDWADHMTRTAAALKAGAQHD